MLKIFWQYIYLLNTIRKSKMKGYGGVQVSLIYPINQKRLREKGYSIYEPGYMFRDFYVIRWRD